MTNLHSVDNFWTKGLLGVVVALVLIALPGCGSRHAKAPTPAATKAALYDVHVYRGVDANVNSGRATLSPSQFSFNADLSTFMDPAQAPLQKPCNYRFQITGVAHEPPEPNDTGAVTGLPNYTAIYDNNPAGHWGIQHPNDVSPDQAKAAVSAYAQQNRGNVVNGTLNNCN
jgi:hypothetical protein